MCVYVYITRLTSKEIFSPSNKIHREVGRAKDLSAPLYETDTSVTSRMLILRQMPPEFTHSLVRSGN